MLELNVSVDFDPQAILERFGLEDGGRVQQAIAGYTADYMIPYWAYDTGTLAYSPYASSDFASGVLTYDTSYARDMYYGVRDDGTPVNYHLDKNPQAGPFPFERMKADHMNDILEEAKRVARGK